MVNCKSGGPKKDGNDCQIGLVPHHLGSLAGVIGSTILCAFTCTIGYLMLKLERLFCTSRIFDLLASLGERD